ncbi:MAG: sterol desaturase [Halorhabdus sp.]
MDRRHSWTLSAGFGISVGGGTYLWLVDDPLFTVVLALFWALGAGLSVTYLLPQTADGQDWVHARWSGAAGGLMALAATLGVSPTLPISADLRLALGLFVVGIWVTAINVGLALGSDSGSQL